MCVQQDADAPKANAKNVLEIKLRSHDVVLQNNSPHVWNFANKNCNEIEPFTKLLTNF